MRTRERIVRPKGKERGARSPEGWLAGEAAAGEGVPGGVAAGGAAAGGAAAGGAASSSITIQSEAPTRQKDLDVGFPQSVSTITTFSSSSSSSAGT